MILSMLNTSFFLKQLGYVDILKIWYTFVLDPSETLWFPRFIKPELQEKIIQLAKFESREILKELNQELHAMKSIIEKEVAPNLKEKMNVFLIKPSEVFAQARKLLTREQFTVHDLIEGAKKIHLMAKEEADESAGPFKMSKNPTIQSLKVITESTKGNS